MDFIVGLPPSKGYTTIMVVVDRLSKYGHFIGLTIYFTASQVAQSFMDTMVKLHSFSKSVISDCDPIFLSAFWKALFRLSRTTLRHSSAYHP